MITVLNVMKIFLNGEEKTIRPKMTIAELISELELDVKKIAIEKDLQIINQSEFSTVVLDEGARIEIVHFIGGG
jgi:thiamine biosynthesis protein ThiS